MDNDKDQIKDKNSMVEANQAASDENAKLGEVEAQTYEDITDNGTPHEDLSEISSTDDV